MSPGPEDASVTTLKSLVEAGSEDTPTAWTELHRRAEAGDTASKKAIADLSKTFDLPEPAPITGADLEGTESLTLPGIADQIHDLLASAVMQATEQQQAGEPISVSSVEVANVGILAAAFRDVDAVLARLRADAPQPLAPTLEAFLTAVWEELQKAAPGEAGQTVYADHVVGRLRQRLAADG